MEPCQFHHVSYSVVQAKMRSDVVLDTEVPSICRTHSALCVFHIAAVQALFKSIFEVLGECKPILQGWGSIHVGLFQFANALPEVRPLFLSPF